MSNYTIEDEKYIRNCLISGTTLNQAIAQLEVLKDEHLFEIQMLSALDQEKIKKKIQELLRQ